MTFGDLLYFGQLFRRQYSPEKIMFDVIDRAELVNGINRDEVHKVEQKGYQFKADGKTLDIPTSKAISELLMVVLEEAQQ